MTTTARASSGAKLNRVDGPMEGEGIVGPPGLFPPNDAFALYGDEAQFMVRTLSSGGVSPNGTSGVTPDDYERFFRLHALGEDGSTVLLERVGESYAVRGGTLRVLGLSDLGQPATAEDPYDPCYDEDLDNYIDIILAGDEAAARSVTHVEVPSLEGGYDAFYNPGGPGRTPFAGVAYTAPGPADLEPVVIALDDPMRVSFDPEEPTPSDGPLTLEVAGTTRDYLLTVPASYTGEAPVPLLFNLHQLRGTAEEQLAASGFDVIAEREGFLVVTPQAVGGVWSVTGFPVGGGADDFAFVRALLDELSASYAIDAERIYATGMSQGRVPRLRPRLQLRRDLRGHRAGLRRDDGRHDERLRPGPGHPGAADARHRGRPDRLRRVADRRRVVGGLQRREPGAGGHGAARPRPGRRHERRPRRLRRGRDGRRRGAPAHQRRGPRMAWLGRRERHRHGRGDLALPQPLRPERPHRRLSPPAGRPGEPPQRTACRRARQAVPRVSLGRGRVHELTWAGTDRNLDG